MDAERPSVGFGQVLGIVRRRAPWILLCVVIAAGAAYGYAKHKTKKYTATAAVVFNSNSLSQQIAGLSSGNNGSTSGLLAQQASNVELVGLGNMADKTASVIGHGLTGEDVVESLSIGGRGESDVVDVSATSTSPALAATIANTYVSEFVKEQEGANRRFFQTALGLVKRQLSELSPAERLGSDAIDLQDRAQILKFLAKLGYSTVQVGGEATVPSSPSSPKVSKDTALGALLGLLLGFCVTVLLERLGRPIREAEELESIYRLPLLGAIPKSSALARSGRRGADKRSLPVVEAEAFSLVWAHVRFFNLDRDLRSVVIASPAPGDGKTTVARHLAEAAARLGSRVLLIEADLRQPTLAQQLNIQSGDGLVGVLIGGASMHQATQSIAVELSADEGAKGGALDVLVAGDVLPPNPGGLIGSDAMGNVLNEARAAYDFVVIDTPPLTAVSDAFPLLRKTDGVVIVGWVGRSRRDAAEQLHQVLAGSGAPLLGVVANGSKSGSPSPYPAAGKMAAATVSDAPPSDEFVPTTKS
jgi:capsular exopolysaccharide synthesis family protein